MTTFEKAILEKLDGLYRGITEIGAAIYEYSGGSSVASVPAPEDRYYCIAWDRGLVMYPSSPVIIYPIVGWTDTGYPIIPGKELPDNSYVILDTKRRCSLPSGRERQFIPDFFKSETWIETVLDAISNGQHVVNPAGA